jgi:hypothetical protein
MIPRYSKFEITFDIANLSTNFPIDSQGKFTDKDLNPFNPDIIDVEGVFSPTGCNFGASCVLQISGFWYQDFTLIDTDGTTPGERVVAGQAKWKIRFTPQTTGTYQYYIKVIESGQETAKTSTYSFVSITSASKGFVRLDTNTHYFRFDNGVAFNPVGLSLTHSSLSAFPSTFADYSSNGVSLGRFTDAGAFFKQEWTDVTGQCAVSNCPLRWFQGLGRYNLVAGYRLDQVMKLAEDNGVYIEFVWGGQPDEATVSTLSGWSWANNPYNVAQGGFLNSNYEFFSDATAKNYVKRKLRYVFSRWGYSPAIFSWESLNEIDILITEEGWKTDTVKWQAVNNWHQEMVTYLKSLDIYHHLNTGSTTKGPAKLWTANPAQNYWRAYWDLPVWNFIQHHEYGAVASTYNNIICAIDTAVDTLDVPCNNPPANNPPNTKTLLTNHGFPIIFGEWGTSAGSFDFTEQNLHDAIWTATLNGATILPWYSENIKANGWLPRFKALSLFMKDEDLGKANMARVRFPSAQPSQLQAYGLSNSSRVLSWIKNNGTATAGTVTFQNMQNGKYNVEIWDPWNGVIQSTSVANVTNKTLSVSLPIVSTTIAFKSYLTSTQITCVAADINCDDKVDVQDLIIVANDFGKTTGLNNPKSDTNGDNIVDIYDVVYVASRFT